MRVVCFNDRYPATSETFVLEHIRGMLDHGMDVSVVARNRETGPQQPLADELAPRIQIRYAGNRSLGDLPRQFVLALNDARARRCLSPRRYGSSGPSRKVLSWAEPWIAAGPHDAILAEHGHQGEMAMRLRRAGLAEAPMVTVFHGTDITRAQGTSKYDALYAEGEAFVANSAFTRSRLIAAGCPDERISVIPMGIRLEEFKPSDRERRDPSPLRVLSVARLIEVKGIEFGLRAVALLRERGVDVQYTVVGDGPLLKELRALVVELGIESSVTFTGRMTRPDVIDALRGCDVMLCPGVTLPRGEAEALGVAPMEAMAMQRTVIATQTGGLPEVLGDAGLLAPERDHEALADLLGLAAGDPDLLDRLGRAGRERIAERFDARALNRELCELIERTCREA